MTNTTTKKGAVKGTIAAAAGIAVLLGGAGTFALWNQAGAIGTGSTGTGELSATIGDTSWEDATAGTSHTVADISAFTMVPGDVLVGTAPVTVTAQGENLKVDAGLDYSGTTLPEDVTATVVLTNNDGGATVTELAGSNAGTTYDLTAKVTLAFDETAKGSMTQDIDLTEIKVNLQQQTPQNVTPGA